MKVQGVGWNICQPQNHTTSDGCCSLMDTLATPSNSLAFYKLLKQFLKGFCPKSHFSQKSTFCQTWSFLHPLAMLWGSEWVENHPLDVLKQKTKSSDWNLRKMGKIEVFAASKQKFLPEPPETQGFSAWFSSKTPQAPSKTNSYFKMSRTCPIIS